MNAGLTTESDRERESGARFKLADPFRVLYYYSKEMVIMKYII